MDENGRGGDDAYDACRYGLMAVFEGSKTPVFDPTTMYIGVVPNARPHGSFVVTSVKRAGGYHDRCAQARRLGAFLCAL